MKNLSTRKLTRLALLTAIIVLMSFTPLGYLDLGPLAITFLTIPVIIGAVTMGCGAGAFLGFIFGITSFAKAFNSAMGGALLSINPFYTLILCVVPRVLEGLLCGLIYSALNRSKQNKLWAVSIGSLSCPVLNTILYMTALVLLFGNSEYILKLRGGKSVLNFVIAMVGVQAVVEAIVCAVIGAAISIAVLKFLKTKK